MLGKSTLEFKRLFIAVAYLCACSAQSYTPTTIDGVYKFLHENGNKQHGATGGSAYCEITPVCVEKVYTTLSKVNWLKGNSDGITMADLGAGFMLPPSPFSHQFPLAMVVGV